MKTFLKILLIIAAACFALGFVSAFFGCTATPRAVQPIAPSWDGNEQDSGLLNGGKPLANGDFVLTAHARDRYNALVAKYGSTFAPPVATDAGITPLPDGTFLIDKQHLDAFARMNLKSKAAIKP